MSHIFPRTEFISDPINSEPSDKTGTLSIPTKKEKRDRSSVEETRFSTHSRKEPMNENLLEKIRSDLS